MVLDVMNMVAREKPGITIYPISLEQYDTCEQACFHDGITPSSESFRDIISNCSF